MKRLLLFQKLESLHGQIDGITVTIALQQKKQMDLMGVSRPSEPESFWVLCRCAGSLGRVLHRHGSALICTSPHSFLAQASERAISRHGSTVPSRTGLGQV